MLQRLHNPTLPVPAAGDVSCTCLDMVAKLFRPPGLQEAALRRRRPAGDGTGGVGPSPGADSAAALACHAHIPGSQGRPSTSTITFFAAPQQGLRLLEMA